MSTPSIGDLARVPTIYNVTMTLADTEYSQVLPYQTRKYIMHTRDETAFRLAFVTGVVAVPGTPYFTVLESTRYWEDGVINEYPAANLLTLYFASDAAAKTMEIIAWT